MNVHDRHPDTGCRFYHDITDPRAFVAGTLNKAAKAGITFGDDEFDELLAEGLLLLTKMAKAWNSGHQYSQQGKFSGYVAMFLPKRLGDVWHRMHPEHRYVTNKLTGRREWHYDMPALSLDGITDRTGNYGGGNTTTGEEGRRGIDAALHGARRIHEFVPIPIASQAA